MLRIYSIASMGWLEEKRRPQAQAPTVTSHFGTSNRPSTTFTCPDNALCGGQLYARSEHLLLNVKGFAHSEVSACKYLPSLAAAATSK